LHVLGAPAANALPDGTTTGRGAPRRAFATSRRGVGRGRVRDATQRTGLRVPTLANRWAPKPAAANRKARRAKQVRRANRRWSRGGREVPASTPRTRTVRRPTAVRLRVAG